MRLSSRTSVVALALAAVLVTAGVGAAFAQMEQGEDAGGYYDRFIEKVAGILGKQPDEVRSAVTQAQKELVDEAVATGDIPEEHADRIKERIDSGRPPFLPGPWGMAIEVAREALIGEITAVEGDTLTLETPMGERTVKLTDATEIRKDGDPVDRSELKAGAHILVRAEDLEGEVITVTRVRILDSRGAFAEVLPGPFFPIGLVFGHVDELSEYLGLTPEELYEQLRDCKSLAEIAGPEKTPELIDRLVDGVSDRIDRAVERGRLTEEQAQELRDGLQERVTKLVNGELPFCEGLPGDGFDLMPAMPGGFDEGILPPPDDAVGYLDPAGTQ